MTLLEADGRLMARCFLSRPTFGHHQYRLAVPSAAFQRVLAWLRALSDGYVLFDPQDLQAKLPGPVIVRNLGPTAPPDSSLSDGPFVPPLSAKPYYVGLSAHRAAEPRGEPFPPFEWEPVEEPLRRTPLYEAHRKLGAHFVPFAGWEMPLRYGPVLDEHRAVRGAAGLFDVGHMGIFEVSGPHAAAFLGPGHHQRRQPSPPGAIPLRLPAGPRRARHRRHYGLHARAGAVHAGGQRRQHRKGLGLAERSERGRVRIDPDRPWARSPFRAELVDLRARPASTAGG